MQTPAGHISRRVFLLPFLMLTVLTTCGFFLLDLYLNHTSLERYQQDLSRLARSGAQMLVLLNQESEMSDFDYFADRYSENGRFRTTIIGATGTVLGDSQLSQAEVQTIENHFERPEIIEARETGTGISRRHSATLNTDLLYVAVRYNNGGQQGYFRVALPLVDLERETFRRRLTFTGFGFTALLIAAFCSLLASNHLMTLIHRNQESLARRLRSRTKEIEMLQNLGTQLTACNSRQEALDVIRLITSLLLPDITGTLALLRASRDRLEPVVSWNGDWTGDAGYSPNQCWALRTGKAHLGNPHTGNMTCDHSHSEHQQMLCIPLLAQGETHGVLHLASSIDKKWTPEEQQLAAAVAEHASLTLASLQLRESLRQQAIRDALTGLYNRRYLLESAEHELSRAMRRGLPLGVMMIDLDYFKKFNDEHGHNTGDFILSEFGRLLRMQLREEDIACRYGGEEFTVLLPETDLDNTLIVAGKIGRSVREHNFVFGSKAFGPITISIGAVVFPLHGQNMEQLLKNADDALYEAKRQGRDRVVASDKSEEMADATMPARH